MDYMQVADDKKLKAIYTLLEDEIEQEGKISLAQYNKELAAAEAEFGNGGFITHTAMKKKIKARKAGGTKYYKPFDNNNKYLIILCESVPKNNAFCSNHLSQKLDFSE